MASPAASSAVLAVVLVATLAAGASAATFTITNQCPFTVWPAATPVGGGVQLDPGQTWTIDVPAGTSSGRVWGRTGCAFDGSGRGGCLTGDCGGVLSCSLSGWPPLTLAEFTLGGDKDYYNLSVIDGFNVPMSFSCSSGETLTCRVRDCLDAYHFPDDNSKLRSCNGNSNYQVVFCP
ncbi:thaumatin-like protein [Oryza brachyantha]|uniref:thaumatin-like protein n=1 Tax=Oryza brachyantha TaxID=4533 RepID=UPI001ADB38D7|nr:thaumatin-like protein [Oryza brachyantha]